MKQDLSFFDTLFLHDESITFFAILLAHTQLGNYDQYCPKGRCARSSQPQHPSRYTTAATPPLLHHHRYTTAATHPCRYPLLPLLPGGQGIQCR